MAQKYVSPLNDPDIRHLHIGRPFSFDSNLYPISYDSIGIGCPQMPVYVHDNENPFFNLCIGGKGILYIDDKKYDIVPGVAMLVGPGSSIRYHSVGDDVYITLWVNFAGYLRKEVFRNMNITFQIDDMQPFIDKFLEIANMETDQNWEVNSSVKLYEYAILINKHLSYTLKPNNKYKDILSPALFYLVNNLDKPYDASALAKQLNTSQTHMCRMFKKAFDCRPGEYAETLKVNYAKSLLENNISLSVDEIARMTGYDNTSYFIMLFKKHTGITPFQYKTTHQSNINAKQNTKENQL